MPDAPPARPAPVGIMPFGLTASALCMMLLIAAAVAFAFPWILRQKKAADQARAISNCRHLGLALLEFEAEYGRFPDAGTAAVVARRRKTDLAPPGTTANDHLRQLIAAEITTSETIFYAKTAFTRRPDNIFNTPETALAPGELGFGYVLNGDTGLNSANPPTAIILCAPLAFDGQTVSTTRFDPNFYDDRIVMLRIDNSATSHPIDRSSGDVIIGGKSWLTPGEGTPWGLEIQPRIVVPMPK